MTTELKKVDSIYNRLKFLFLVDSIKSIFSDHIFWSHLLTFFFPSYYYNIHCNSDISWILTDVIKKQHLQSLTIKIHYKCNIRIVCMQKHSLPWICWSVWSRKSVANFKMGHPIWLFFWSNRITFSSFVWGNKR